MTITARSHPPIISDGQRYTLHHLQPHRETLVGHGRDGSDVVVRISYGCHVYSRNIDGDGVHFILNDENARPRRFCPDRYELSLGLPDACRRLIQNNEPTWRSKDRNETHNMAICENWRVPGQKYVLFYSLHPSRSDKIDVEMLVKSAFLKDIHGDRREKREGLHQVIKRCYFQNKLIP